MSFVRRRIGISLEINKHEADVLALRGDLGRTCIEVSRTSAERAASEAGGQVDTDVAPEVIVSEGTSPTFGDAVLVMIGWTVLVPETFVPPAF